MTDKLISPVNDWWGGIERKKKPKLTKLERNTIYKNLLYYFRSVILYHTELGTR
ncbi:hypothetical protein [Lactococcus lactis]|uniref:hypothetical protein n=1 Tax=Lactococcus lactis TaxID=1358 RepID=UPI001F10A8B9|nr:hypothetical protein [Lactococcus lactis]MCH5430833.1 hypothetical protein [Lactococcus lactis]